MIRALASFATKVVRRWLPDALLFAAILTSIVVPGDRMPTKSGAAAIYHL